MQFPAITRPNPGTFPMTTSLQTMQRVAELRDKARSGTMTLEDCKEAIAFLRAERLAMPAAKSTPRTAKLTPNADDLLSELGL